MKHIKIVQTLIVIALIITTNICISQNNEEYFSKEDSATISKNNKSIFNPNNKLHFGFNAGTGVLVSSDKSFYSNLFVAPNINYDINSKFTISSGILVSNLTTNSIFLTGEPNSNFPKNITQTYVYLQGQYKLNNDITIYGSGFYNTNNLTGKNNNNLMNFNNKGYSLGVDYNVGKDSKIGLEFQFSDKPNPFYNRYNSNSPYTNSFPW